MIPPLGENPQSEAEVSPKVPPIPETEVIRANEVVQAYHATDPKYKDAGPNYKDGMLIEPIHDPSNDPVAVMEAEKAKRERRAAEIAKEVLIQDASNDLYQIQLEAQAKQTKNELYTIMTPQGLVAYNGDADLPQEIWSMVAENRKVDVRELRNTYKPQDHVMTQHTEPDDTPIIEPLNDPSAQQAQGPN